MMKEKRTLMIKGLFYAMVAIFILIVALFFILNSDNINRAFFPVLAALAILFFICGGALTFLTLKSKIKGKQKTFLLLTGISALGFLVCVILHNFFYGLGMVASNIVVLKYLFEFLHVAFFIISIFVCPIVFLIGAVGSVVKFNRK